MDKELLKSLGIDENDGIKAVLDGLEEKQFEYLQRLETVSDDSRRKDLELILERIDKEIEKAKEQIQALQSGIFFDQGNFEEEAPVKPAEPAASQEAEKPKAADKAEEVKKKIEAIKAKEAERQAKEAERQRQAAAQAVEQAKQEAAAKAAAGAATTTLLTGNNQATANNVSPEMANALLLYKKGDLPQAFEAFRKLAEANDNLAMYTLSNMYRKGAGTQQNDERAEFWLKRAADCGNVDAQTDYGVDLLANNHNDINRINEGEAYLRAAADRGNKLALKKYLEAAKAQVIQGASVYKNAMRYCDKLASEATDSFEKEQYANLKAEYALLIKEIRNRDGKKRRSIIFLLLGTLLVMFGILYVFGGAHGDAWTDNKFLAIFPDAPGAIQVPKQAAALIDRMEISNSRNFIFGLELLFLAGLFFTAGKNTENIKLTKRIKIIHKIVYAAALYGHIVVAPTGEDSNLLLTQCIFFCIIFYIVGKIPGVIVGKIAKSR